MSFNFDKYLLKVRSKGRYSLTLSELLDNSKLSDKAIQQTIFRAKKNNKISQIRQGFYVIIPPEYSNSGLLPVYYYIDDLMLYLNRDYYIGLFSAALLHGAGHQQTMTTQVIIERPALRTIKNNKLELSFFTKNKWSENHIVKKKTDAGYIKVSSLELTAFDIINYHNKIGGINRALSVLEELCEEINADKLFEIAKNHNNKSDIQRLGFLCDKIFNEDDLANSLYKSLKNRVISNTPLSLLSSKKGELDKKWNIVINTEIDY